MDVDTLQLLCEQVESRYTQHIRYLVPDMCSVRVSIPSDADSLEKIMRHAKEHKHQQYTCSCTLQISYMLVKNGREFHQKHIPFKISTGHGMMLCE